MDQKIIQAFINNQKVSLETALDYFWAKVRHQLTLDEARRGFDLAMNGDAVHAKYVEKTGIEWMTIG